MKRIISILMATVLFAGCTTTEKNARHDFYLDGWNNTKHFAIGHSKIVIDDSESSGLDGGRSMFGPLGNMVSSAIGVDKSDDPEHKAKMDRFYKGTVALLTAALKQTDIKMSDPQVTKTLGARSWIKDFYQYNSDIPFVMSVEGNLTFNANKMMRKRKSAAKLEKDFSVSYQWTIYNNEQIALTVINTQHNGKVSGFLTYESEDFSQILEEYQKQNVEQLTKALSNLWAASNGKKEFDAF